MKVDKLQQFIPLSMNSYSKRYLHNAIIYLFIFGLGLVVGLTLSFYLNETPFNIKENFEKVDYPPGDPNIVVDYTAPPPPKLPDSSTTSGAPPPPLVQQPKQTQPLPNKPVEPKPVAKQMPVPVQEPKPVAEHIPLTVQEPKQVERKLPLPVQEPKQVARKLPLPVQEPKPVAVQIPLPVQEPKPVGVQIPLPVQEPKPVAEQKPLPIQEQKSGLNIPPHPPGTMHNMNDAELLQKAGMISQKEKPPVNFIPKLAFMYLSRGDLPLAPLWERFFAGNEGKFSIYVHTQPFYNGNAPPESVFHNRRIPSKQVEWGKFSMIEAERRLIANALLDVTNQRFILLSEACIPLYNFSVVYKYLIESTQTFFESYDDPSNVGRGRYNRRMMPHVTLRQWRKGSQWFEVDRQLALDIITDIKYYNLFKRYCKPDCYSDEHYLPTMLTMKFGYKNANRTLTWVDWSKGGPHPTRFGRYEVNLDLLKHLRTGNCLYNGRHSDICHLFARKFTYLSLSRLLLYSKKGLQY